MSYMDIEIRIEQLKYDAYNGDIPTWYAFQEIDRLEKMLESLRDNKYLMIT